MATESTTQATTQNNGADGQHTNKKIEFSPEQQAAVDAIVDKVAGRVTAPLKEQITALENSKRELETRLAEAEKNVKKTAKKGGDTTEGDAEVEELKKQLDEFRRIGESSKQAIEQSKAQAEAARKEAESARQELLNEKKLNVISREASKFNFANLKAVEKLTQDNIKWDDAQGKFVVYDDNGRERYNSSYEPMTVEEFYAEFAASNKYLVRGDVKTGAGSTESARSTMNGQKYELKQIFGKESNSQLAMKLYKEDPKLYKSMKEQAKASGLIA